MLKKKKNNKSLNDNMHIYTLEVKIKFRLGVFNLGWFSVFIIS